MKNGDWMLLAGALALILRAMSNKPRIDMGPGWVWPVPCLHVESNTVMFSYKAVITQGMHAKHAGVDIMYARQNAIDKEKWPPDVTDAGGARQHAASKGAKYFAPVNTPIVAVQAGEVRLVQDLPGFGVWIMIDHGPQWTSSYSHLRDPKVAKGDTVTSGQQIGTMGHADLDGEKLRHLHFELWSRAVGGRVNPAPALETWERGESWTA